MLKGWHWKRCIVTTEKLLNILDSLSSSLIFYSLLLRSSPSSFSSLFMYIWTWLWYFLQLRSSNGFLKHIEWNANSCLELETPRFLKTGIWAPIWHYLILSSFLSPLCLTSPCFLNMPNLLLLYQLCTNFFYLANFIMLFGSQIKCDLPREAFLKIPNRANFILKPSILIM